MRGSGEGGRAGWCYSELRMTGRSEDGLTRRVEKEE